MRTGVPFHFILSWHRPGKPVSLQCVVPDHRDSGTPAQPPLGAPAVEFLAKGHRHGVHQVCPAGLDCIRQCCHARVGHHGQCIERR